ncbi:Carbonyl reductase [NADPH] 3 [Branchiostoma belcheri]|nr:Carbonyl reductase [NADPH] 3 [Branchiostoma belcheri]
MNGGQTTSRVALVTGSNKGIGFEIVRRLCKEFDGIVYLTDIDEHLGQEAVQKLKSEGLNPSFHQLDITNEQSIQAVKKHLLEKHGGLDVLVNNAGFGLKPEIRDEVPYAIQAEKSVGVNFSGTLAVSRALLPIIRPHGRVVNMSSQSSNKAIRNCSAELQARFRDRSMKEEELVMLMNKYIDMARVGKHKEHGYPNSAYAMSKIGVTSLTYIQAREMEEDPREDILVNCCCPGWCKTDMAGWENPPRTAAEGADTPVFLALLPPNTAEAQGLMYHDRKPIPF